MHDQFITNIYSCGKISFGPLIQYTLFEHCLSKLSKDVINWGSKAGWIICLVTFG